MKRRSQTAVQTLSKLQKSNTKTESRSTHKTKDPKTKHGKQQKGLKNKKVIQDYVMIDGNIYKANTATEREEVHEFVNRFKRQPIYEKPLKSKHQCQFTFEEQQKVQVQKTSAMPVQQIVKNLPMQQKLNLMKQLEKQLGQNPELLISANSEVQNKDQQTQDDSSQKYNMLNVKLNFLEEQLNVKRQTQIEKINKLFYEGQLTASERKNKISQIDKKKGRKVKIINCTRSLFYTLLHNKFEPQFFKNNNIDEAIKQLDSFSDLDGIQNQHSVRSNKYKTEQSGNSQSSIQSETQFEKIEEHHRCQQLKYEDRIDTSDKKSANQDSLLISPDKGADKSDRQNDNDKFQCSQQSLSKKLKIPLLLTKQKIQEMEWQKKAKAAQKMRSQIDKKIAFQMSQIEVEESKAHFTTLADMNGYIVSLYEYIIKTDLQRVVQRLNFPYGKSICDKLFFLQQGGQIDQTQYYPVLDQSHLNGYNMEMALAVRRFSDQQKIHNRAVFDCFNTNLNAYRPYYDLQGDVYPWSVSEKGITFYQISQENIQQVFQKTKIKVLQYSSSLCGIIPMGMDINECPELVTQKNNQLFQKQQKLALMQEFGKWNIKITDYDVMVRIFVTEQILLRQMMDFTKQLHFLQQN